MNCFVPLGRAALTHFTRPPDPWSGPGHPCGPSGRHGSRHRRRSRVRARAGCGANRLGLSLRQLTDAS
jgi:hypothetical protein